MRILLASWHRAVVGGAETYARGLIPGLLARGHEVAFLHEHAHEDQPASVDRGLVPRWCALDLGPDAAIAGALSWRPDVLYNQGLDDPELEARLASRVPAVLFAHGYYGTCATGFKRHAFPKVSCCTRTLGAGCLALNYTRRCGGLDPRRLLRTYRWQTARRNVLPLYRAVLVASRHMRQEYLRHGVPEPRLHVAPLPPAEITADPAPAPRPVSGRVLFLGRHSVEKGLDYLIEALPVASAALGRTLTLIAAGTGPTREQSITRARRRGVDAEFPGWVQAGEKVRLIQGSGLLAIPSLWPEPYGLGGIEAGSLGVPSVGFAMGAIPEWLEPGTTGELAPADPPTPQGLAAAITRALSDPAHYRRLCEGAWRRSSALTLESHLAMLEGVLAGAG
jgi:glycosyltransferase involved in cell wall biosynthesis